MYKKNFPLVFTLFMDVDRTTLHIRPNIFPFSSIKGHWLGNQSSPIFTIIDTPGFGNDLIEEERTIEGKIFSRALS